MENKANRVVWSGFFIVLGIVLPQLFHLFGGQYIGQALLPMHLPVFLAGMTLGPLFGFFVGILTPLLSALLTGMPPFSPPIAILMILELAAYGLISGYLVFSWQKNIFWSLALSMLGGRLVFALALALVAPLLGFTPPFWTFIQTSFLSGIPGIILQFLLLPLLLRRTGLQEKINRGV